MRRSIGLLLVLIPVLGCSPRATHPNGAARTEVDFPVPPFELTERSGKSASLDDLKGKVWVASFVFARCSGPCPQVTRTMAQLQRDLRLKEADDLRLVTFTIDPERDTPNELRDYAKNFEADRERWLFLTGPEVEIHKLLIDGFKTAVIRTKNPREGEEFDHSTRLAVVDRAGVIRGYFDGLKSKSMTQDDFDKNLADLQALVERLRRE